jgi:hypothetical protein
MAEKGDSKSDKPSGLATEVAEAMVAGLLRDRRIVECQRAAARNRKAEIGFFVRSTRQFFYDRQGKPVVPGFEPGLILKGDWQAEKILTAADAAANQAAPEGFVTACSVDLSGVRDIGGFVAALVDQFGPIAVAPQFQPDLVRGVPYIAADPAKLAEDLGVAYDGTGITVCVVDMGCDFAHRNFRVAKGGEALGTLTGSRLRYLIDMKAGGGSDDYTQGMIEGWLATASPYDAAPYKPHALKNNCAEPGSDGTHGTLVMDIAAGNGNGTGIKGVAPAADLCFVQVYVDEIDGRRFVSGAAIFNAVKRAVVDVLKLDDNAQGKPTVFNVSLGTNDGPHDSFDHGDVPPIGPHKAWNVRLDNQFTAKNGRAVVWSAGNQFRGGLHASGFTKRETVSGVSTSYTATFDVRIPRSDLRSNEVKIWFNKPAGIDVELKVFLADARKNPAGVPTASVTAPSALADEAGTAAGSIEATAKYGSAGGSTLHFLKVTLTPRPAKERWETWRLEVTGHKLVAGVETDFAAIRLDAWIERDDGDQVTFKQPPPAVVAEPNSKIDPLGTLSANASGVANATVVGAISTATYVSGDPLRGNGVGEIMAFSSAGPTRDSANNRRPDVCAPGELIVGAKSKGDPVANGTGYGPAQVTAMSGTSMAAPFVTGLIALLFDKKSRAIGAVYPGSYPTSLEVRAAVIDAARPNIDGAGLQWDPQRGFGCVDAVKLLT